MALLSFSEGLVDPYGAYHGFAIVYAKASLRHISGNFKAEHSGIRLGLFALSLRSYLLQSFL